MKNKGSIYAGLLIFYVVMFLFFTIFGVAVFETIITGEFHTIKNDLFLINRNVLLEMQRDVMGEDKNAFYEENVKKRIAEEIKRQWNLDVSRITENGFIQKVDIESARIIKENDKMYIESIFNIQLRPIVFYDALKDKLVFKTKEVVKVEKMKGWSDE